MDQFSRRDNFVVRRARDDWAAIYADLEEGRNIPAHCDARILIVRLRRRRTPKHISGRGYDGAKHRFRHGSVFVD
jgi:hypothetical protein